MHNNDQPNGQPTTGAAPPGSAAKQQAGSAPAASGATAPGTAGAASPSPATPQQKVPLPAAAAAAAKSPPQGSAANPPKATTKPQSEQPTAAAGASARYTAAAPDKPEPKRKTRPYFISPDLPPENLPPGIRVAHDEIVAPFYEKYVLGEQDPMAKAIAGVFSAEASLGIVAQYQAVGATLSGTASEEELERLLKRHDRSVMRQVAIGKMLIHFKSVQARKGLLG